MGGYRRTGLYFGPGLHHVLGMSKVGRDAKDVPALAGSASPAFVDDDLSCGRPDTGTHLVQHTDGRWTSQCHSTRLRYGTGPVRC